MKTAISIPDKTFDDVSRAARTLGISRSEFFTTAAQRMLDQMQRAALTPQIDAALAAAGADDTRAAAVAHGRARLGGTGDDW